MIDINVASLAVASVLSFTAGWVLKYVGPKSKVTHWFPHTSFFQIPVPGQPSPAMVATNSVTVQNRGRLTAKNVEVVFTTTPSQFTITPQRVYTQTTTPQGQHVLSLGNLGHNEWLTIEALGLGTAVAGVVSVRSDEGPSTFTPVQNQFVLATWYRRLLALDLFVGAAALLYLAIKGVELVYRLLYTP